VKNNHLKTTMPNKNLIADLPKSSVIINADDFGISGGVNFAIKNMIEKKKLNSVSIMLGYHYFTCHFLDATEISNNNPQINTGLHFNLTTGYSMANPKQLKLLAKWDGKFKNNFVGILKLAIFKRKKLLKQVEIELEKQLEILKKYLTVPISHIDSHHHIHYIPGIFNIVAKIAKKHHIPRIRIINESFINSYMMNDSKHFFAKNDCLKKWLLLSFFGLINGAKKIRNKTYFFSILNSCSISRQLIDKLKIPKKYQQLEIMIHPGDPKIDEDYYMQEEIKHLSSTMRYQEQL
jgi:predicted glycoside hydrolase/deacetylase ChbG (UPF0249 family)